MMLLSSKGKVSSLKRFKDDVREITTGYEGGLGLENYNDIKEGDILESYIMKESGKDKGGCNLNE